MGDESKPAVETQISLTMMRGNSKSTRRSHLTNVQRQTVAKEFEHRQNVGEDISQEDPAEWAFKELQIKHRFSGPTFLEWSYVLLTSSELNKNKIFQTI